MTALPTPCLRVNKIGLAAALLRFSKRGQNKQKDFNVRKKLPDSNYIRFNKKHVSIKNLNNWIRIFEEGKFKIENIKMGGLLYGTPAQDKRRAFFVSVILLEILLDKFPLLKNLSEDIIISLRK